MLPKVPPDQWSSGHVIRQASEALLRTVTERWPTAAQNLATAPIDAARHIDNLTIVTDGTVRHPACPIDGTYDPQTHTITYRETQSQGRNNFTILHELAHHLLALNEEWCYDIAPALARHNKERTVEELIASTFAAQTLIPDDLADEAFANGITSHAVVKLAQQTAASPTACLVRALAEPSERLVMLTNLEGVPWFVQTSGTPYAPGKHVRQPAIEAAAQRAQTGTGSYRLVGGEGLRFGTGKVNPHVAFDVTVEQGLVYAIIETTPLDSRITATSEGWTLDCLAGCGHTFTANESPGNCGRCSEARCSRCRGCDCRVSTLCQSCTITLPVARAQQGHKQCENCE